MVFTLQEEHRAPARKRRWRGPDFRVLDRLLVGIEGRLTLKHSDDLARLLAARAGRRSSRPKKSPARPRMPRWLAQKMAYCLQKNGRRRHRRQTRQRLALPTLQCLIGRPIPRKRRWSLLGFFGATSHDSRREQEP